MSSPIPPDVLARIAQLQLELPHGRIPGRPWRPATNAEDMLLRQAQRLDGIRRQLLAEVQRLSGQTRYLVGRVGVLERENADLQRAAKGLPPSTPRHLPPEEHEVIAAAAAGEGLDATARRLQISPNTLKGRRKRILQRYQADTITQAVALAVDAGDVRLSRTGVAP